MTASLTLSFSSSSLASIIGCARDSHSSRITITLPDASLLRGAAVVTVLRGFGAHFSSGSLATREFSEEDAEQLFAQSRQVETITYFLSHAWRDTRLEKWLALCLYFNHRGAMLASILVVAVLLLTGVISMMPAATVDMCGKQGASYAPWCCIIGIISYIVCVHAWHYMPKWLLGRRGDTAFLDKVCVHQMDPERKKAGIRAFAAFVAKSKHVLCLWSPDFFTRLWCTLEMAALVVSSEKSEMPLVFLPLKLYKLAYGLSLFVAVACIASSISNAVGQAVPGASDVGLLCIAAPLVLTHTVRQYFKDRVELERQLQNFAVMEAACASEDDRLVVFRALRRWFGDLRTFDELVRTQVRTHIVEAIGSELHVPLALNIPFMLLLLFQRADAAVTGCYGHSAQDMNVVAILRDVAWMFCLACMLPVQMRISSCMPRLPKRCTEACAVWAVDWTATLVLALTGSAILAAEYAVIFVLVAGEWAPYAMPLITLASAGCFLALQRESFGSCATCAREVSSFSVSRHPPPLAVAA